MTKHNHVTRDIKTLGKCPACDEYHDKHIPKMKTQSDAFIESNNVTRVSDLEKENKNND